MQKPVMLDIIKADLDLDGKKDQIMARIWPHPVVEIRDVNRTPTFDVEILVKSQGKIEKAGTLTNIEDLQPVNIYTIMTENKPSRVFVIFKVKGPGHKYWAVKYPLGLFPVPDELMEK